MPHLRRKMASFLKRFRSKSSCFAPQVFCDLYMLHRCYAQLRKAKCNVRERAPVRTKAVHTLPPTKPKRFCKIIRGFDFSPLWSAEHWSLARAKCRTLFEPSRLIAREGEFVRHPGKTKRARDFFRSLIAKKTQNRGRLSLVIFLWRSKESNSPLGETWWRCR
jgi:hypothetical protein